jgi:hypothetical protein
LSDLASNPYKDLTSSRLEQMLRDLTVEEAACHLNLREALLKRAQVEQALHYLKNKGK